DASVARVILNQSAMSVVVTGIGGGQTRIVLSSQAGADTVGVFVTQVAAAVRVPPDSSIVVASETSQLTAVVTDSSGALIASPRITWSSSNDAVASVDRTGRVSANTPGAVTLTARVDDAFGQVRVDVARG